MRPGGGKALTIYIRSKNPAGAACLQQGCHVDSGLVKLRFDSGVPEIYGPVSRVPTPPPWDGGGYDAPVVVYIHTYLHTYLPTYLPTYLRTYIPLHYLTLHYLTLPYLTLPYLTFHTYIHTITLHYLTLPYLTLHYLTLHSIHTYIHTYTDTHTYIHACMHAYIHTYQHTNIRPPQATGGGPEEPYHHHRPQGGGPEEPYHHHRPQGGGTRRTRRYGPPIPIGGGGGGWPTLHHIYIYTIEALDGQGRKCH